MAGVLRNLRIVLGVDFNESGLRKADRALAQLDKKLGAVGRKAAVGAGLVALAGSATTLTGALIPATASVAALPGVMAVAGAASATLKVGVLGVGDAMSEVASGDAAALDEALAKLSPTARAFARETAQWKGAFEPIQQAVQDRLFAGLAGEMRPVVDNLLPGIRTGMLGAAAGFNLGAKEALKFGQTPMARGAVNKVFASSSRIMTELGGATQPALAGVAALTVAGLPLAERMASWAANGARASEAFLTSERGATMLASAVDRSGDTLAQLGRIGGNTVRGLIGVFGQMADSSDGVLDTIERLTVKFEAWSKSAQGQRDAAETFALLRDVVGDVADVLPLVLGPLGLVADLLTGLPGPLRDIVTQGLALALVVGPLAGKLGGLASAGLHVADGARRMRESVQDAGGPMAALGNTASRTRGMLAGAAGMLAGPWGIALAAGATALALFASRNDEAEGRVRGLTDALMANKGALNEDAVAKVRNALETQGAYKAAQELGISLSTVTDAALGSRPALATLNAAIQRHTDVTKGAQITGGSWSGTVDTQVRSANLLRDAVGGSNTELADARAGYQRLTAAAPKLVGSSDAVAGGIADVGTSADSAGRKVGALTAQLARFKGLTGDADLAAISFRDSVDDLSKAFSKNGSQLNERTGRFNINTKAGRENNRMLIDAIRNAVEHSEKVKKETGSVDKANVAFNTHITRLRGVLEKSNLSKAAIDRLISRYASMPGQINNATGKIKDRTVRIEVKAGGQLIGYKVQGGTLLKASGGVLPGYTPGRDVHTFTSPTGGRLGLSGGEAVMRPEWTRAVGEEQVNQWNAAARAGGVRGVAKAMGAARYADGGIIAKNSISGIGSIESMVNKANTLYSTWATNIGTGLSKAFTKMLGGDATGVVKAAARYIGRGDRGGNNMNNYFNQTWGYPNGTPWCANFVSAAVRDAKAGKKYAGYPTAAVYGYYARMRKVPGDTARPGDLGVYNGPTGHINIVEKNLGRGRFTTIGGNEGPVVRRATRTGAYAILRPTFAAGGVLDIDPKIFRQRNLDPADRRDPLRKVLAREYDDGGILEPGYTLAYNGTGKPEYTYTHRQMQQGGGGRPVVIHNHFHIPAHPNKHAIGKEIYDSLEPYMQRSQRKLPK